MLRSFLVTVLLFFLYDAPAQKLYSLRYANGDSVVYECFMVYFSPTNCYMRIRFKNDDSTSAYNVVQVTYNSITGKTKQGEDYLCLKADPHPITVVGDTDITANFIPDSYIWFPKATTKKQGPYLTRDMIDFTIIGAAPQYMQLNPRKLTEEDLLELYNEDESSLADMKAMCGLAEIGERYVPPINSIPTIHFIMAANTLDPKIGVSCKKDMDKLLIELDSIASWLGLDFKSYLVYGNDFNRKNLLSRLNEVSAKKNDVVIFSYSGHGNRWADQKDTFPFMNLWVKSPYETQPRTQSEYQAILKQVSDNTMTIGEVFNIISKKRARLSIVLGDMCNTSNEAPKQISDESYEIDFDRGLADLFKIRNLQKLGKLFLETKGNLIAVATKPNETAGGNNTMGGFFTSSFLDAVEYESSYSSKSLSWNNIINETIKSAFFYKKKSGSMIPQTGIKSLKVKE
ncbi:MAG: caspase family protein [Bacteroidota bacterium]